MENKKPIIIAVIVLILALTGWVLVIKFKNLRGVKNANIPVSSEPGKYNTQNKEGKVASGIVISIREKQIFIEQGEGRQSGIDIVPNTLVKIVGSDKRVTLADLKVGDAVEVKFDAVGRIAEIRITKQ